MTLTEAISTTSESKRHAVILMGLIMAQENLPERVSDPSGPIRAALGFRVLNLSLTADIDCSLDTYFSAMVEAGYLTIQNTTGRYALAQKGREEMVKLIIESYGLR